jgi:hypothetical protein
MPAGRDAGPGIRTRMGDLMWETYEIAGILPRTPDGQASIAVSSHSRVRPGDTGRSLRSSLEAANLHGNSPGGSVSVCRSFPVRRVVAHLTGRGFLPDNLSVRKAAILLNMAMTEEVGSKKKISKRRPESCRRLAIHRRQAARC